jgi:hypothetical protein
MTALQQQRNEPAADLSGATSDEKISGAHHAIIEIF